MINVDVHGKIAPRQPIDDSRSRNEKDLYRRLFHVASRTSDGDICLTVAQLDLLFQT